MYLLQGIDMRDGEFVGPWGTFSQHRLVCTELTKKQRKNPGNQGV
jgi:hypothetical protein